MENSVFSYLPRRNDRQTARNRLFGGRKNDENFLIFLLSIRGVYPKRALFVEVNPVGVDQYRSGTEKKKL